MVRRPLRPSFELTDKTRLIDAMRIANELAGRYEGSSSCKSDSLRQQCDDMRKAIHTLVTSFTGDPHYFSYRYNAPSPSPTSEELDGLATRLFNAYHQHPNHKPMVSFAEIEKRDLQDEIEEWNAIRAALELMPNTMYIALTNMNRGAI